MELDVGYQIPDTKIMPGIAGEERNSGVLLCLLPNNLVFHKGGLFSQSPHHPHSCSFRIPGILASPLHRGSVQFSSVAQSCPTLCDPMDCRTPGFPVHHQLLELAQTLVRWAYDAIQSSHPLSSPFPSAFNLSQHHSLFHWVSSSHQVAKVLEFQLQHQSSQWISGLISFRIDWFDLAFQGILKSQRLILWISGCPGP